MIPTRRVRWVPRLVARLLLRQLPPLEMPARTIQGRLLRKDLRRTSRQGEAGRPGRAVHGRVHILEGRRHRQLSLQLPFLLFERCAEYCTADLLRDPRQHLHACQGPNSNDVSKLANVQTASGQATRQLEGRCHAERSLALFKAARMGRAYIARGEVILLVGTSEGTLGDTNIKTGAWWVTSLHHRMQSKSMPACHAEPQLVASGNFQVRCLHAGQRLWQNPTRRSASSQYVEHTAMICNAACLSNSAARLMCNGCCTAVPEQGLHC